MKRKPGYCSKKGTLLFTSQLQALPWYPYVLLMNWRVFLLMVQVNIEKAKLPIVPTF